FQGQRADDVSGETPIVFPMLDFNHVGEPGKYGGHWKLDANLLALTRTDDTSTYRASVMPQWELPYTSNSGEVYRVFASVQADAYWVNDVDEIDAPDNTISGATGRFFPQAGIDWRLPLARTEGRYTQIIEPMLGLILAPPAQNHELIPNEDSLSLEFDDTNLFSANRFSGLDRVEGGPRFTYGLHSGIFGLRGGFSSFFVGQSYRFLEPDEFGAGTGLEDRFSDFVGRVRINPTRYLSALYRFRLDKDDLSPVRNELQASIGVPAFQIDLNYLSVKQQQIVDTLNPNDDFDDREEMTIGLSSQVTRRWQFGVSTQQDLSEDGGSLRHGAFLFYKDDCFEFRADYQRTFTQDRDIRPSDTIYFRFVLRTLGEFQTQTGASF
ncbi:MAG: LPS-assembly protein LptD, partial [Rhodospirillaceae bacterium]